VANSVAHVSAFAAATGVGSWPGTSPRLAAEVVVGELHTLPHLVELPARGVGADMIGRAGALLVDIAIDTTPRGYRVAARPGAVSRRARSYVDEDVDALQEAWERAALSGGDRVVKVQAPGPVTLAAQLELPNGHRAITDAGALRDLTTSLAEGVAAHEAELSRRLDSPVVVQLDEPLLPAALAGRLTGVTALTPVHPVDETVAVNLLDECAAAVGGETAVHCCASELPWEILRRSKIHAIGVDPSVLGEADLDGLGEFIDSGRTVMLGVVPSVAQGGSLSPEQLAQQAATLTDRLGFPREVLAQRVGVTPACGLAGATPEWASRAIELAQKTAETLAGDPEAI
jgi:methionine synthase II (cobalamin-independent)